MIYLIVVVLEKQQKQMVSKGVKDESPMPFPIKAGWSWQRSRNASQKSSTKECTYVLRQL